MANPTTLKWRAPPTWSDNVTPFKQADFKGWLVENNGETAIGVGAGWDIDGAYEVPLASVPVLNTIGKHTIVMRMVSVDPADATKSLVSDPSNTATYTITGTPLPPLAVAVV